MREENSHKGFFSPHILTSWALDSQKEQSSLTDWNVALVTKFSKAI